MTPLLLAFIAIGAVTLAARHFCRARYPSEKAKADRAAVPLLEEEARSRAMDENVRRALAHLRRAHSYLKDGRRADAVEEARQALVHPLPAAREFMLRINLAYCLEASGDHKGAAAAHKAASRSIRPALKAVTRAVVRGSVLWRDGRYTESIAACKRGLELARDLAPANREMLLSILARSCWSAGQVTDAYRYSSQSLQLNPEQAYWSWAYQTRALALTSQGRLDEAEEQWMVAFDDAVESGTVAVASRYLSELAEIQRRRGDVAGALNTCERASALSPNSHRTASLEAFQCCLTLGWFNDARQKLEEAAAASAVVLPAFERRRRANTELCRSLLHAEEGNFPEAASLLRLVGDDLAIDEKWGLR